MNSNQVAEKDVPVPDPVYVNSRREAIIIFRVWLCALLWAIPCSYLLGYTHEFDPTKFSTVWGIPTWIFWGIGFPWLLADAFTIWFCFCSMADDDLGEAQEAASQEAQQSSSAAGASS